MLQKFIVSGCSFTEGLPIEGKMAWPTYVAKHINVPLNNFAANGAGNGYISRSIIHAVDAALQKLDHNDLLVGIMWSGVNRLENYHSNTDKFKFRTTYRVIDNDTGCYVSLRPWEEDNYTISYIKNYYDPIGSSVIALEHILRTQWYLKSIKVKYFMSMFHIAGFPEESVMENPNVKHLYNMIDWSNFLPVKNYWDWCVNSGLPGYPEHLKNHSNQELRYKATHPSEEQHEGFAKQIILPFLQKSFNIKTYEGEMSVI